MSTPSQSNGDDTFSLRIVTLDYYMSPPIPNLDFSYSIFQGRSVEEVPVIRIYGSSPAGQKACLHIHQALPYLYIPCPDNASRSPEEGQKFVHILCNALEKALKHKGSSTSKRQHVHECRLVRAKKFYGYHPSDDLFIKIYLYYPHEVGRAASMLLDGAVLSTTFQPHESHIPYLLQFLVDYNLYGMGHVHLSKFKFRLPLPDACIATVPCSQRHGLQAHRGSALWLSSTVPSDIIWPDSPNEGGVGDKSNHLCMRQSTCALEVDASVNDILNEKYKMYTSLSQTRSEVKMVQSLVSIWEEEYERSGTPEAVLCPDSCKPTPEDVLSCFNHGLEYEKAFSDLYMRIHELFPSRISAMEGDENPISPSSSNLLQDTLKSSNEGNKSSGLPCRSFSQERENAKSHEEMNQFHSLKSISDKTFSEVCRNAEDKALDTEALGLLRWLASTQAAEDVSIDDDTIHEAILSPLLSAKSYKEALEIATLDYESASQQECQDILDSLEAFHGTEGSMGQIPHSTDQDLTISGSSCNVIPQADGSFDDDLSTHQKDNLSEANMTSGRDTYSVHQVERCNSTRSSRKQKINKLLWGPLPFSFNQEEQKSSELACFVSCHDQDMKSDGESSLSSGSKTDRCCDAALETYDEKGELAALNSVRDLMRRKRCRRTEQLETVIKNIEIMDLCTEELIHHKSESKICAVVPQECPTIKSCSMGQDSRVQENVSSRKTCTHHLHTDGDQSLHIGHCSPSDQKSSISILRNPVMQSNMPPDEKLHLQQESVKGGCVEANTESQRFVQKSTSLLVENLNVDGLDFDKFEKQPVDEPLKEKMATCRRNLTAINDEQPLMNDTKEHKNVEDNESTEDITLGDDLDTCINLTKIPDASGYVEMTFSRRPPSRDELCNPSEDSSGIMAHADNSANINDGNSMKLLNDKESALGVPIHFQNDGSVLYLLTHAFLPPTLESVQQWLLEGKQGNHLNLSAGDTCDEVSMDTGDSHCLKPDLLSQASIRVMEAENHDYQVDIISTEQHGTSVHFKGNVVNSDFHDLSQISGPNREDKSGLTPLSQTGFRDPASIGGGQQLTLISMEVLAESRGDLLPDPKVDAINVLSLAVQEDSNHAIDVHILMRCNSIELFHRNVDGVSNCQFISFDDENLLLDHFVRMITSFDPDILMGWEIQSGSLGFLAERAAHLGVNLLKEISRIPSCVTKFNASDLANPEPCNVQNTLSVSNAVCEFPIIEDEWGRTHASGIHVSGRIVLNIWRLMRAELNLNMYSVEAVAEEVLRCKIPSISNRVLNNWFLSGPGRARYRCIEYVIERAKLNLEIMNQLDMINRTSELARVFGIDFFSVLSRGSQFRVESMLLRLAHTQNYLAISPGNQQVASQPAMECLPLVMEPESAFYADPVVVLDFQSLYPSVIIAYNLCYSTCLGTVVSSKENILGVTSYLADPLHLKDLKQQLLLTPNGILYVPSKVRRGVLPRLLEEILSTRIMVKKAMKRLMPSQKVLQRIFNARQLALKLIANVTYGYTAAGFSGRMPCAELADSIVQCGRRTLETSIAFVNQHDKWKARVIYGDTDSMFVLLKGRSREEAFRIGTEIASAVTSMNPYPVTLKMEKVYHPCFLLTKKRYVGYSYETPDQKKPTFDAKGIETVRRDTCPAVAKTLERSIRLIFEHQDISVVKTYLERQWRRILCGKVSLQDFVFSKEVRLGAYSSRTSTLPPAAIVATKAMQTDPRAEPQYGERIPYVVIHGEPGARLVDMVVSPYILLDINSPYRLNELYYIKKQIIPALQRVFGLVGADLNQWFSVLPRPVRPTLAKRHYNVPRSESWSEFDSDVRSESSKMLPSKRSRIDTFYISKHCTLCGKLAQLSAYLCDKCSTKESLVATAVIGNTAKLERELQHLASICRHCGGGDWLMESGVKCISLACSVFYERRKIQKELQATSSFATVAGFYPKCMVEWF